MGKIDTFALTPKALGSLALIQPFSDSRGWSMNDIYAWARDRFKTEAKLVSAGIHSGGKKYSPNTFSINFSKIYPGAIKAWHKHEKQDDYFFVLEGDAQVGLSNGSYTEKVFIGEHNQRVLHIPAGVWHGITPVGDKPCSLLYLITNVYNPENPDEIRATEEQILALEPAGFWDAENK